MLCILPLLAVPTSRRMKSMRECTNCANNSAREMKYILFDSINDGETTSVRLVEISEIIAHRSILRLLYISRKGIANVWPFQVACFGLKMLILVCCLFIIPCSYLIHRLWLIYLRKTSEYAYLGKDFRKSNYYRLLHAKY